MSKIFYLEDELDPKEMIMMFGLSGSRQVELESIDDTEDVNKQVKSLFINDPLYYVEYDFVNAIEEIKNNIDEYSIFILDRNLSEHQYDSSKAKELCSSYDNEREGDEIVRIIDNIYTNNNKPNSELLSKIIFLTANDNLKDGSHLPDVFKKDLGKSCVVVKGSKGYKDKIREFVENNDKTTIVKENYSLFQLIMDSFDDVTCNNIIKPEMIRSFKYLNATEIEILNGNIKNPNIREIIIRLAKILVPDSTIDTKTSKPITGTWPKIKHLIRKKSHHGEHILYLIAYIYSVTSKDTHKELFDPSLKTAVLGTIEVLQWFGKNHKSR